METELLKEPWIFPQSRVNAMKEEESVGSPDWEEKTASFAWEEKTVSSTWEENFQDLSTWCMDTFQGQCDFHAGESAMFKLSGTKYEGNSGLPSEEGVLKSLTSMTGEEKWRMKMGTAESTGYSSKNIHSLHTTSNSTIKYETEEDHNTAVASNMPIPWVKVPKETATVTSTTMWGKQNDTDVGAQGQFKYHAEEMDLDEGGPTSFDSAECQRETWDVLRTIETGGSDFNLLSYLCDDEICSPEDSIVSTDSSTVSKLWPQVKLPATVSQPLVKVKTETKQSRTRSSIESRATSTATSSSTKTSVASRKSGRRRSSVTSKVETSYSKVKRPKRGKSNIHYSDDSDSDDGSYVSNYRESREKNNEASRKSRMNKKAKENEMASRATELERDNRILKMKVEELEKLVTTMRSALLKSALKKEF